MSKCSAFESLRTCRARKRSDPFVNGERRVLEDSVTGKQVHDARIVAAMNVHQITKLLTFNTKDFKRFQNIELIDPNTL